MTIWLTDSPGAAAPFVGPSVEWNACHAGETDPMAALSSVFNPNQMSWRADVGGKGTCDDRVIILVDTAERSQFDAMLEVCRTDLVLPEQVICLALTGSRFRGQRSRPWTALRGNLHLTARYTVSCRADVSQAAITMIPAIASAETMVAVSAGSIHPEIKWVNDVLVDGKKISGVLSSTQISGAMLESVVFGIGMNINHKPEIQSTPFVTEAGCLADCDDLLRDALPMIFNVLLERLDEGVDMLKRQQVSTLFDRYCARAGFIGERVVIWPEGCDHHESNPLHQGRVVKLNPDLSLVLEGVPEPVRFGRLAYDRVVDA